MDFLDYSSDAEESEQNGEQKGHESSTLSSIHPQRKSQPSPSFQSATTHEAVLVVKSTNSNVSLNSAIKKKKTLDISFLPQEIQDALLKGVNEDSDSEDDQRGKKLTQKDSQKLFSESDPLLSMLPPPKSSNANNNTVVSSSSFFSSSLSSSTVPPSSSSGIQPLSQSHSSFLPRNTSSSLIRSSVPPVSSYSGSSVSSSSSNLPSTITTNLASQPNINMLLNPNFNYHDSDGEEEEEQDPRVAKPAKIHQPSSSSFSSSLFNDESSLLSKQEQFLQKRKREREIEHSLLSGDTSLLDDENIASEVTLRDVTAPSLSWDALGYAAKQEQEQAIINKYTGDGNVKGMMQPNKLQNRRHQLSSLALKAAETEIASIDAKTVRTKSKRQTQAKYGW
jgi:hypothetical protein